MQIKTELIKQFLVGLINSFIPPLVKISWRRRHAQTVKNGASSHKTIYIDIFFRDFKSWRASKSLYWFQSYGNFVEWVDFDYWWSCIGKGLPCSLRSRLVLLEILALLRWIKSPVIGKSEKDCFTSSEKKNIMKYKKQFHCFPQQYNPWPPAPQPQWRV